MMRRDQKPVLRMRDGDEVVVGKAASGVDKVEWSMLAVVII